MHTCHAYRCDRPCHPTQLMCKTHWGMVAQDLQQNVYACYRRGQCKDKKPSTQWRLAAYRAIASVAQIEYGKDCDACIKFYPSLIAQLEGKLSQNDKGCIE